MGICGALHCVLTCHSQYMVKHCDWPDAMTHILVMYNKTCTLTYVAATHKCGLASRQIMQPYFCRWITIVSNWTVQIGAMPTLRGQVDLKKSFCTIFFAISGWLWPVGLVFDTCGLDCDYEIRNHFLYQWQKCTQKISVIKKIFLLLNSQPPPVRNVAFLKTYITSFRKSWATLEMFFLSKIYYP